MAAETARRVSPRVARGRRFCWHCSRQLYAHVFAVVIQREDGSDVLVHGDCAEEARRAISEGF